MKHEERVKLVREAFDLEALQAVCMASQDELAKYGSAFHKKGGEGKFAFYFADNNAEVLAIAHMDSVQDKRDFGYSKFVSGKEIVFCPQLDDRLGVYVVCELLPKLGIKTDIILTTDEEQGKSTGELLVTDKKYRWMFQFDRMGSDVVMYQYRTDAAVKKLEEAGFRPGYGSASDISKMGDLGCLGFNFGVGYEDAHSKTAWADLGVMFEQVARFTKFYRKHQKEHMVYDKTKKQTTVVTYSGGHYETGYSSWGEGGSYMSRSQQPVDYENQFGRNIAGTWYAKLVWNEHVDLFLPNTYLYSTYPNTQPPSDEDVIWKNSSYKVALSKRTVDGKWTEAEVLEIVHQHLKHLTESKQQLSLASVEGPKLEPKFHENDMCKCHHSYFVHRRLIWHGTIGGYTACDMWKCKCKAFDKADDGWTGV